MLRQFILAKFWPEINYLSPLRYSRAGMLSMDFEEEINKLLAVIPRERRTYLFSATMTSKPL